MDIIFFNFISSLNLGPMVPPVHGVGIVPPILNAHNGFYLIWNSITNTRYAGKTRGRRFSQRQQVVWELGINNAIMQAIWVYFGSTYCITGVGPGYALPPPVLGWPMLAPGVTTPLLPNSFYYGVSVERILIRFTVSCLLAHFGGHVQNTALAGHAVANPSPYPIDIIMDYPIAGGFGRRGFHWPVGGLL